LFFILLKSFYGGDPIVWGAPDSFFLGGEGALERLGAAVVAA